jgi:hypothetical protein
MKAQMLLSLAENKSRLKEDKYLLCLLLRSISFNLDIKNFTPTGHGDIESRQTKLDAVNLITGSLTKPVVHSN